VDLLTDPEVRILGSLIEKEITTPDYYPLSLNALMAACNQLSNRHPVVHFDEATVVRAVDDLRKKDLVHQVERGESRVTRYRHVMPETMGLDKRSVAVMCVLMLRGPQTVGEIRTRSNRICEFENLAEVETVLDSLIAKEPFPLVVRLPRQPGQKEIRYGQLLSGDVTFNEPEGGDDRIGKLESAVDGLRKEVEVLQNQFEQFRKQFE
jgi:uncharacterized protein YceH (UPF0502 family)